MMEDKQDNKIFVRIDLEVVKQLAILAKPYDIYPDLITKVIKHACECDKWKLERRAQL